ncbi:uncharacterized protein ARMOST_22698 [Armillaria ostoyae]|uniref:Uncharacterized protein n=1 Tax=Armillaria ostoyae TaxID=47428 RepID=A0A284SDL7_ARMOS|nr:uncharacterized protein ARMOST_22698 [Armillaria ostoyae]
MLYEAHLFPSFWGLAVLAFVYVRNRCPTAPLPGTTPYTGWHKKKPDVSNLWVFGCLAYVHVKKNKRRGLQPRTMKCIFVGYPSGNTKTLTNPFGDLFPSLSDLSDPPTLPDQGGDSNLDNDDLPPPENPPASNPSPPPSPPPPASPLLPDIVTPPGSPFGGPLSELSPSPSPSPPPPTGLGKHGYRTHDDGLYDPGPSYGRGMRQTVNNDNCPRNAEEQAHTAFMPDETILEGIAFSSQTLDYLTMEEGLEVAFEGMTETAHKASAHDGEPRSFCEAMGCPPEEAASWHEAAMQEIQALIENGVFELVKCPPNRKADGSRWVFKVKRNADGSIEHHKARLVAKGYSQRPGFDYTETFSPTPKWAALRAVLALGALEDLELWSVDISSAFLNGELTEEVYMEQPEGFEEKGKEWVWCLFKSLYGLKQAGREWHKKLHATLTDAMGFEQVKCEHSIWVYKRDDERIIVPVFVDDMTIAARTPEDVSKVIDDLKKHFKLCDLGPTSYLLGVEIKRDHARRTLTLSQRQYILDILQRVGMADCNPVSTPLDPNVKLTADQSPKTPEEYEMMWTIPYLNVLGSVAYLAIATRPDVAYPVSVLSRFSKNPGTAHWEVLKRLLRYLKGTIDYRISYAPDLESQPQVFDFKTYCDADHGGDKDNGRSMSGYVVKMGTGAISWMSRLQAFMTLSTTEAEYVSAVSAGQEILWLRNLFTEFRYSFTHASVLHINNESALSVAWNPEHHGRVKHLDLRFYWLRNEVEKGRIHVVHLRTEDMPADALTKGLGREKLKHMITLLGLVSIPP